MIPTMLKARKFTSLEDIKGLYCLVQGSGCPSVFLFGGLMCTFIQGGCHVTPMCSLLPPWDLSLVLLVLQKPPFGSSRDIPMLTFLKGYHLGHHHFCVVGVRAASLILRVTLSLVLHKDVVVCHPCPSHPPKVVLDFHLNEDIVVLSLCLWSLHCKEFESHSDVV